LWGDDVQYEKRTASGDAGEYFAAYTITRLFGWPCRLYGVDLGVDGEVEIIDDHRTSVGDIIKIQIKAFDDEESKSTVSIYVEDRHIQYWKKYCLPVVLCAVDLHRESVYWKQITATEAYESSGKSGKVELFASTDLLTASCKSAWSQLAAPSESKNIDDLFGKLAKLESKLPDYVPDSAMIDDLIQVSERCEEIDRLLGKAEAIIAHYPWRVSSVALGWLQNLRYRVLRLERRCGQLHNAW
jgi:hypothetical protein